LLLVDDDQVAATLSAVLARHGFDVSRARNGEEALQALVPQGADCGVVLLNLGLPGEDGYEICGRIRKRTSTQMITVTAHPDVRSRIHGLNSGAYDYVVKPYDTGELLARIPLRRAKPCCASARCTSNCPPARSAWTARSSH
jgi:DNA-binding response OmpR family regulator